MSTKSFAGGGLARICSSPSENERTMSTAAIPVQ